MQNLTDDTSSPELDEARLLAARQANEIDRLRDQVADLLTQVEAERADARAARAHAEHLGAMLETIKQATVDEPGNALDAWAEAERLKGEVAAVRLERDEVRQEREEAKANLERAQADLAQATAALASLRAGAEQPAA